jgi:hypothetical protein
MRFTLASTLLMAACATDPDPLLRHDVELEGSVPGQFDTAQMTQDFLASGARFGVLVDPVTGDVATLQNLERTVNSGDFSVLDGADCVNCGGVNSTCTGAAGFQRQIQIGLVRDSGSGPVDLSYVDLQNWTPTGETCNGAPCPDPTVATDDTLDVVLFGSLGTCSAFAVYFDTEDVTPPAPSALQNATATFSQTLSGPWNASEMIDGDLGGLGGWAIATGAGSDFPAQTAVFETVDNTPGYATGTEVTVQLVNNYTAAAHHLGCYELSVTTANRSAFADGLQSGGNMGAEESWSPLAIFEVLSTSPGQTSTITGNRVVMSQPVAEDSDYTVRGDTLLTGITGVRLQACKDASLPFNGPGISANGNFVLTEFRFATRAQ